MTLQPLASEFPYIWGKFLFSFLSVWITEGRRYCMFFGAQTKSVGFKPTASKTTKSKPVACKIYHLRIYWLSKPFLQERMILSRSMEKKSFFQTCDLMAKSKGAQPINNWQHLVQRASKRKTGWVVVVLPILRGNFVFLFRSVPLCTLQFAVDF